MAKRTTQFVCQDCGATYPKWSGKCDACNAWNTLVEEARPEATPKGLAGVARSGRKIDFVKLTGGGEQPARWLTGIAEFDRVAGGGLVHGSATLVGGDPGIGKSTLLMQVTAKLASRGHRAVYISGEEAIDQLRLRAARLGLADAPVDLAAATDVRDIVATLDQGAENPERADVVIIDSIQTMFVDALDSAPGTVAQVRSSAQELIRLAKRRGFALILVGHVTKEGAIAGPRVLEHMVDTVLYFEGERGHQFRILRAVKNRFGAADEIGVFEMSERGLMEVQNPSALFLGDRDGAQAGNAVFAGMEGTRPVLVEIQALVAPSQLGTPRRAVIGWDSGRLAMVLAVLEARCGVAFGPSDVYLNVAGGLRIQEPAADLAVAAALVSSRSNIPLPADTAVFGEIGLSGEIRPVGRMETRLKEAAKLGFARAIIPSRRGSKGLEPVAGLSVDTVGHLEQLAQLFEKRAKSAGQTPASLAQDDRRSGTAG